jgi:peptidoglycan/xylan/chitin deacetylase (PgdA/CDA1 family)
MGRKTQVDQPFFLRLCSILLFIALMWGCATPRVEGPAPPSPRPAPRLEARVFPDFVAVIAHQGDTFTSLAAKYLNDSSMDWFIAEYNRLSAFNPGQTLIIPLKPYEKGGLTLKGYQIVPVLSYHNFSPDRSTNRMTVTRAAFEEQMKFLKEKGYRVITLNQFLDFLNFKAQIPKKSVVITIDDGWRSTYDIALPILKKYGYPATLFVYTDLIVGSQKTLSWELVQEIARSGLDIQGHTKTHRDLTLVNQKESFKEYFEGIQGELSKSAGTIKAKAGKDIKYLAYPNGETNHLVIELAQKEGYLGAFTAKRGENPFFIHNYRINRSMIYGDFDLNQFIKNLAVFSDEALK